jgi:glycosyltransferase involved in cell wall biosynthesis
MSADVLYLSFDGMTDPLGRSQVLPYLAGLADRGHRIRVVSLEKAGVFERGREVVERICRNSGLDWHPKVYRTSPPILSGLLNLGLLRRAAFRLNKQRPADFSHCRADLPALAGLALKRRAGLPLLYDMRSFWADERVEGGQWDQSKLIYRLLFRYFKKRQRTLLAQADEVVTLADEGQHAIEALGVRPRGAPVTTIPCCADFDLFIPPIRGDRADARAELEIEQDARLLIHVGSFGCNCLLAEMLDFFLTFRKRHPGAQFLFVAPSGEEIVRKAAMERGIEEAVHVRSAAREEVPRWLRAADVGVMFVRPVWSKKASSPTKLGEMLATGLPVVANRGVGDVAEILSECGGLLVERFDAEAYAAAIDALERLPLSPEQVRQSARRWFDLQQGIDRYDRIYRRLSLSAPT